jgi:hypothetical protein
MDYLLLGMGLVGILAVLWLAYLVHLLLDEVAGLKRDVLAQLNGVQSELNRRAEIRERIVQGKSRLAQRFGFTK